MSDDAFELNSTVQDSSDNFIFKYLSLLENSDYLLKSNTSVFTALNFLSQCFDSVNDELGFLSLSNTDQTSVVNILISLILAVNNIYQNETNQTMLNENDKYLNDISQTLFVLSTNLNEFIHKFQSTSEKCIDSVLRLLNTLASLNRTDKTISIPMKKLFSILVFMSKFHSTYDKNWKNTKEMLESLKIPLQCFDYEIDTKWLTFIILHNLQETESFIDNSFDFLNNNKNKEIGLKIGLNFLDFLETENFIYQSKILRDFLSFIYSIDHENSILETDRKKIVNFYIKYLSQNQERLIELIEKSNKDENSQENKIKTEIDEKILVLEIITCHLTNFSDRSIEYSTLFHHNQNCLDLLFKFIDNDSLMNFNNRDDKKSLKDIYENVITFLYNLSRLQSKFLEEWNAQNPVEKCLKFLEKNGNEYKLMTYVLIANVASDDQIKTLPELKKAIETISNIIKECANCLENDQNVSRAKIQVSEGEELQEMIHFSEEDGTWNIMELLEALYHMSVNDTIKKEIYETYDMKSCLKKLIVKGNDIEKSFSLKLLYQLCFDNEIICDLEKDQEFTAFLLELSKLHENGLLKKNCDGIIWKIQSFNGSNEEVFSKSSSKNIKCLKKHIMISYNGESRKTCLAIKEELEKRGFKIWIDVENIAGSSLESMAKALEESLCVLMGMTEKYKMSPNCRLEAEYAIQLNKPIIPLILQKGYKPDGWLGIILGAKIFVNFEKYSFEECIRRLLNELEKITGEDQNNKVETRENLKNQQKAHTGSAADPSKKKIINWDEEKVENWIQEKQFNKNIIENLRPCNGKILYQMYTILETIPEFFYSTIRSDSTNKITLRDLAEFSFELRQLFN